MCLHTSWIRSTLMWAQRAKRSPCITFDSWMCEKRSQMGGRNDKVLLKWLQCFNVRYKYFSSYWFSISITEDLCHKLHFFPCYSQADEIVKNARVRCVHSWIASTPILCNKWENYTMILYVWQKKISFQLLCGYRRYFPILNVFNKTIHPSDSRNVLSNIISIVAGSMSNDSIA